MVRDLLGLPGDTPLRFMSTSVKLRSESPLFGLAREEIVRLLGPPDGGKDSPTYMSYRLGFMGEEGYLEEEWHLLFDFNKDGFPSRIFVGD
ncbi:MAG: hypothetical protein DWQ46_13895 [Planctomycetota bacterium]|nr:MAG: hypothetical protein DWQ46_13895 [Planctomycetota bacterium]